jgi:site-specific recombinase XerC
MNDLMVVEKIAQWQRLKGMVLDSVSSPITKRVYNMALDEFMAWFQQEPRPGFTKATVSAWRVSLEERRLGSSSITIRMSAIRQLAAEAADNGLLAPELAAGISRVRSAKSVGIRVWNWLSVRQAQSLLNAPDVMTVRSLRDRAILAVLLGCGLRRSEVGMRCGLANVIGQNQLPVFFALNRTEITLEKIWLMLTETPGMMAPAATATNPAIRAYSMRS